MPDANITLILNSEVLREAYREGQQLEAYITQLKHTIASQRRLLREVSLAAHAGAWHDVRTKVKQHLDTTLENY